MDALDAAMWISLHLRALSHQQGSRRPLCDTDLSYVPEAVEKRSNQQGHLAAHNRSMMTTFCFGGARRGQGEPGGAMSQEEPGGARRSREEPGGARRSQEEPGGARKSQEEPGGARRSQEEPGGARRSQEQPGWARGSKEPGGARGVPQEISQDDLGAPRGTRTGNFVHIYTLNRLEDKDSWEGAGTGSLQPFYSWRALGTEASGQFSFCFGRFSSFFMAGEPGVSSYPQGPPAIQLSYLGACL